MPVEINTQPAPTLSLAEERKRRRQKYTLGGGGIILLLLCFVLLLRAMVFEVTTVISGSMEPTLRKGDYALVDHRIALRSSWQRGDIVLFAKPDNWEGEATETFVKRIIGEPGDTVQIIDGNVWLNGKQLEEPYIKEKPIPEQFPEIKLAADEYYVLGDNRNNSEDSRDNGPIAEKDIRGKFVRVAWPLSRAAALTNPWG